MTDDGEAFDDDETCSRLEEEGDSTQSMDERQAPPPSSRRRNWRAPRLKQGKGFYVSGSYMDLPEGV